METDERKEEEMALIAEHKDQTKCMPRGEQFNTHGDFTWSKQPEVGLLRMETRMLAVGYHSVSAEFGKHKGQSKLGLPLGSARCKRPAVTSAGDGLCSSVSERGCEHALLQGRVSQGPVVSSGAKTAGKGGREAEGANLPSWCCATSLQVSILWATLSCAG